MTETIIHAVDPKHVESLLTDVFKLMEYPAKLELKDMADGSLGVAVHFEGELPGITPGKRSYLVDSVQFWLNKVVNRPNTPRRWVNLGVNGFPEPRQPNAPQAQPAPAAPAEAKDAKPAAKTPEKGQPKAAGKVDAKSDRPERNGKGEKNEKGDKGKHDKPRREPQVDERTLTPAADPVMSAVGALLAEKSAKLGRLYGVMGLNAEQRSLLLKAADEVPGVKAKAEGEGHWRRLVMVPEKLTVIPKKQVMPDYDDEDEEDE